MLRWVRLPVAAVTFVALASGVSGEAVSEISTPDWRSTIERQIVEAEYEVSWQDRTLLPHLASAWHAPNRAQGFRTYFTGEGIRVIPRTEESPSWEWGLSLVGYGRAATSSPVEPARVRPADGNRVEYDRGAITEWYVNDRRGLEQGFTLRVPPEGSAPIFLALRLEGTLSPSISEDGQSVDFTTPGGENVVRYAALVVRDALGEELRSWIEGWNDGGARGIRIVVDDRDAVYPLTVDPLATSPVWTAESDQGFANFGGTVATAGDVNGDGYSDVIVGSPGFDNGNPNEGRAWVYKGSAAGPSVLASWTAEGGDFNQGVLAFGTIVATAGDVNGDGYSDVIVVGSGGENGGRAFVYHGSASHGQQFGLQVNPTWTTPALGFTSVASAGDVNGDGYSDVIAGARDVIAGPPADGGRVSIYHGSANGLQAAPSSTVEGDQASSGFGSSVATAGDVNGDGYSDVIVGARDYDHPTSGEGRAFVYHGSASGLSVAPSWTAESNQTGADFGVSVATAGDVDGDGYSDVIVGAYRYDGAPPGESDAGRAFVYHGTATGLSTIEGWAESSDEAEAGFGISVATAGDVNGDGYADVIVGAHRCSTNEHLEGCAYVYHGSALGLEHLAKWSGDGDQENAGFGRFVATAGDLNGDGYSDIIVGAESYDNPDVNEGRAFIYEGSALGLSASASWTAESDQPEAGLGISVATAGDVNGDGYSDIIAGADQYDNGELDEGRAFVYDGSASGLSEAASWTAEGGQANAGFGHTVATVGDVNGDGYSDVIVGAHLHDGGQIDEGRTFVYHGSASGLAPAASWTAESNQTGAEFGISAATAGDVNGDGYSDVVVGAHRYDSGEIDEGRAFVYRGSASGLAGTASWTAQSDQANAGFGGSVATAGDVNRDGYSDVIVGAPLHDNDQTDEGRAFVYHGSASGLAAAASWIAESDQAAAGFGISAATAGDVNGDGYSDVIVGADQFDNGETDEGRAFVYHGSASGLAVVPGWTAESDQAGARFGVSVATAGSVDGDGYSEVVVGAYLYDNGQTDEGRAFVYHGSAAGLSLTERWTAESHQPAAELGRSVATAGDVNGDGYADVVVGAHRHSIAQTNENRVFLHYGNGGPSLSVRAQQRRSTNTAPIGPLGASDSSDSFRLAALARSPYGRGRVKLEWEVKPLGSPLDGTLLQSSAGWTDSGTTGAALQALVGNLTEATAYHWRVRLRYDPTTTPFQQRSRWLTPPWNGLQETDLRTASSTAATGAGEIEDLILGKATAGQITLAWTASCLATDLDHGIYEGTLGGFTTHASRFCSTAGSTTLTFTPPAGSAYYLIVPLGAAREGSYGADSSGTERPVGQDACLPQQLAVCD